MNEYINISIAGIESDMVNTLQNKYNNVKVTYKSEKNTLELQLSKSLQKDFIADTLDEFLNNFHPIEKREIIPSWFFDESNQAIKGPDQNYLLTQREVLFLKMLIANDKIITYKKMINILWSDSKNVSQNAMRLFTKNFKKKLPPNILKNFYNKGYKLVL